MEDGNILPEECCVCGRQLVGSRWVKGGSQLRHSGRAVAEAVTELLGCRAQLLRLCFRCYRLVLALDYHTHQLQKQRLTLLKLYGQRERIEQQTCATSQGKILHSIGGGGGGDTDIHTGGSLDKDINRDLCGSHIDVDKSTGQKTDQKFPSDTDSSKVKQLFSHSSQCSYDHEYYMHDKGNLSYAPTTPMGGCAVSNSGSLLEQHCSEKLKSGITDVSTDDDFTKKPDSHTDNTGPKENGNFSADIMKRGLEAEEAVPRAPGIYMPQSLMTKRRKTAKKWDDFEYYEVESKTAQLECEGRENFPQVHQFQLPPRTGRKKCQKCKEELTTKKAILNHKCGQTKKKEQEKVTYTCKGCFHIFLLRREYIKHADACYKNTPVTCNLCLVKLPSAAYLPRHLAALHQVKAPLSKGDILCEFCGRGFSRKEALERHEARVHGRAHGSHQCPLCGRTFPHTSLLAEHLRAHQGYTCPECSKVFSCRSNLTLHRRAHHMRKAAYHCTTCNKHWKFHASYTYHMKKFHRSMEHRCPGCRLVLYSEEMLHQHSLTCAVQDTQSEGAGEACGGKRQHCGEEETKQIPNNTASTPVINRCSSSSGSLLSPAQLSEGMDSLVLVPEVKKMQVYQPQNTPQGPPAGEIIVEVLEDIDVDYQYVILVEDAAGAHLTMPEAAMWNT